MRTATPDTVTLVPINRIKILNSRDRNMKVFEEIVDNIFLWCLSREVPGCAAGGVAPGASETAVFLARAVSVLRLCCG